MSYEIKPTVAVLLAAYNGMQFVEEQVESILNQEGVCVTLFVSVDLSVDSTYEWFKALGRSNECIVLLPYGERFGGAALNFFRLIKDVDFSRFDYVSLADQDDIWLKSKLQHAVRVIKKKNVAAFSSDVTAFWADGREALVKKSYPIKKYDYYFEAAGPGCSYVFDSICLGQFKLFLMSNWESVSSVSLHDWLIYAYFRHNGMAWFIDDRPLMRYRQHGSNQVGFNSGFNAYMRRFSLIREKWYSRQVLKILNLLDLSGQSRFSLDRSFLVRNFWQLRRRPRDAFILLFMVIFGFF